MGNAQSHRQHSFLYPPAALAFKSGAKAEGIPSPLAAGRPQFEHLVQNPEFKNYVLSHLDDEALVMSLLQNAASEDAILASIEYFSEGADPQKRDAVRELIQNWKDATTVGMQVRRPLQARVFVALRRFDAARGDNRSFFGGKSRCSAFVYTQSCVSTDNSFGAWLLRFPSFDFWDGYADQRSALA